MTVRERTSHLARAKSDPKYAAILRQKCKRSRTFFINLCCWTFDPRIKDRLRRYKPFLLYPRQEEYVTAAGAAIDGGEDLLTEKSRDTGVTWCTLAVLLHGWIFEPGFQALVGGRKEDQVDKSGDPSAMFWKLDFMIMWLPEWAYPHGYVKAPPHRTYLKIENPTNGSVIIGESSNPDFGRGGRYTVIFPDEFAAWEWASPAWTACSESTTCRLPVSTPKGMNFFGRLANDKTENAITKFRFHWSDDPRHTIQVYDQKKGCMVNPWLERQKKRFGYDLTMLAQELEIDYNRSVKGRVYTQVDLAGIGRYRYNPFFPTYVGWDFGLDDETALVWVQYNTVVNRFQWIDCYQASGKTIDFFVPFITGQVGTTPYEYTEAEIEKIKAHRGWQIDEHYGDPAGRQRNQVTNTSVIEELAKPRPNAGAPNGIHVITNTKAVAFEVRRTDTQIVLMRSDFDEAHCGALLDALRNAKFPDEVDGTNSTTVRKVPVHDWTSHLRTAVEYVCVNQLHTTEEFNDDVDAAAEDVSGGTFVGGVFYPGMRPHPIRDEEDSDYSLEPRGRAGY